LGEYLGKNSWEEAQTLVPGHLRLADVEGSEGGGAVAQSGRDVEDIEGADAVSGAVLKAEGLSALEDGSVGGDRVIGSTCLIATGDLDTGALGQLGFDGLIRMDSKT
jgi:hypothetical protein